MSDDTILALDLEAWRPVPGWSEYEVSDVGRVRRIAGGKGAKKGRVLRPWVSVGYHYVGLWRSNKQKRVGVHVLVARAFLPPPIPGQTQVSHRDGVRLNNTPLNLRWATPIQNAADRWRHGTDAVGESNPMAKLTLEDVAAIKAMRARGFSQTAVAADFGVVRQTVSDIERGRRWECAQ